MTKFETALVLLSANAVLGGFDTVWYHEISGKLPVRGGGVRTELALHAGRDAVYAVIYGTLGWVAWHGPWAYALAGLLAVEVIVTFADFVVEDRVRRLSAGERVLHGLMAIVYGAMLAFLLPVVVGWADEPAGLVAHAPAIGTPLRLLLTAFAVGIALSGVRDTIAAVVGPAAGAPWRPASPAGPQPSR